ncbi:MAG: FtsW/RodA/SpoVE family cell cycle protein [Acidimicrobiia bacterium]|nr:FtsW/RodA/SpoVE family cell cycle protein [Acidimicrobiia bacterium]
MTRNTEALLLGGASTLAAFGVTLVNLSRGGTVDAQAGLTFLVFGISFGGLHFATRIFAKHASTLVLPPVSLVTAIGFIEIYRISPERAALQRWWLLIAAAVAILALWALNRAGLARLRRYRNLTLLAAVALLMLPLLPTEWPVPLVGAEVNGSRLWIVANLGFTELNFQPAEVGKLLLVVFLAGYLADRQMALTGAQRHIGRIAIPEPRQFVPLLLAWVASLGVLVFQRDLGASLLLFALFVAMLYAATGAIGYLWTGSVLTLAGGIGAWIAFEHVQRRIDAWIRPFADFEGAGYQIAQGSFALGTGSLAGAGPGLGRPDLIPAAVTDFIFAAVGEEFGFAGTVAVLAAYALLVAAGFGIALQARDRFRKLLAAGLSLVLGLQVFLILGGVMRIVPLTGIALPFMSYGGSALVGNMLLLVGLMRVSHEEAL